MPKNKLLYANVKIPIEISENGTVNPLSQYVDIEFSECTELPEPNKKSNYSVFTNKLMDFFQENDIDDEDVSEPNKPTEEIKLVINQSEIAKVHQKPINSSFKKRIFRHRQTAKNFHSE